MSALKYLAFDLEIAKTIPEGEDDWQQFRPFGISCAAAYRNDGRMYVWSGVPQMTPRQCREMTDEIISLHTRGWTLVTWNGLGFDLDVLQEECQDPVYTKDIIDLALGHIDPAFALLCDRGFMIGLDKAAKGMGLKGKLEGMSGALAPVLWAKGEEERKQVLEYVRQDARVTGRLFKRMVEKRRLRWRARSGKMTDWQVPYVLLVEEALKWREPRGWPGFEPWPRSKFTGWIDAATV